MCVGHLYFVSQNAGDRYFLRTLLTTVNGATSYEDLRTYDGVQHETFKAACVARGLYENGEEWEQCLREAALMQSGPQLRSLFVMILIHESPAQPRHVWDEFHHNLSDDCLHRLHQDGNAEPSADQIASLALHLIANLLAAFEKTLADFSLPTPVFRMQELQGNRFITEQLAFNVDELRVEADNEVQTLSAEQLHAYHQIMASSNENQGRIFFIDGPSGTGKTYLENLLLKSVRCQGHIALAVASSGIAALLISQRRTAHSRFKIPIDLKQTPYAR